MQWGNLATVAFLLFAPHNQQLGAAVCALADGPLAAALIAWQSAWVFGSTEHSIRYVLLCCMHPGNSSSPSAVPLPSKGTFQHLIVCLQCPHPPPPRLGALCASICAGARVLATSLASHFWWNAAGTTCRVCWCILDFWSSSDFLHGLAVDVFHHCAGEPAVKKVHALRYTASAVPGL